MALWDYIWIIKLVVEILKVIIQQEPQAIEDLREVARAMYDPDDRRSA